MLTKLSLYFDSPPLQVRYILSPTGHLNEWRQGYWWSRGSPSRGGGDAPQREQHHHQDLIDTMYKEPSCRSYNTLATLSYYFNGCTWRDRGRRSWSVEEGLMAAIAHEPVNRGT